MPLDPTDLASSPNSQIRWLQELRPETVLVADDIEHVPRPLEFLHGIAALARCGAGGRRKTEASAFGSNLPARQTWIGSASPARPASSMRLRSRTGVARCSRARHMAS
jgi:hypothetical protein